MRETAKWVSIEGCHFAKQVCIVYSDRVLCGREDSGNEHLE